MSMYENYERIRNERGWNNKEVSERAGVAEATLSYWKHGKRTLHLSSIMKIAEALGVTPGAIIDG